MTKDIGFDLEFTKDGTVIPISLAGRLFLQTQNPDQSNPFLYRAALELGLHARFENILDLNLCT